jgi:hypothetical protein
MRKKRMRLASFVRCRKKPLKKRYVAMAPTSRQSTATLVSGHDIANLRDISGLYAWYYRPFSQNHESLVETVSQFFDGAGRGKLVIYQRYGMRLLLEGEVRVGFGKQEDLSHDVINEVAEKAKEFIWWFFESEAAVTFSRPLYVGIAKNLRNRVYQQHYCTLSEYWDDDSKVSRYLRSTNSTPKVEDVMNHLDLPRSFALEARIRGISPNDLVACVFETGGLLHDLDEESDFGEAEAQNRRSLERLLHLLTDPILGRR